MLDVKAAPWPLQVSRRTVHIASAGVLMVAAIFMASPAHADGHPGGPGMGGPGGPGGPGMMMFGGPPEHVARSLDRMLDGLGVTDAQRAQIRQIAMAAATDLKTQREADRGMMEKGVQIFTAPTVDANAAEALRQQMSAQRDMASKRRLQAMLDIANVLTPEQRAKIGERIKEHQAVMKDRMQRMQHMQQEHGRPMNPPPAPQK